MTKKKILIVEDDQDMRRALNVRLRANNYDTAFASDAVEALSIARKEQPDLVLLDLGLPAGDGFTVMDRMKDIPALSCLPVIVVSARDPAGNKDRALSAGAAAFFQKPVDNGQLLAAIRHSLGEAIEFHP
jgi:DNA-binding response OmpR family regulator